MVFAEQILAGPTTVSSGCYTKIPVTFSICYVFIYQYYKCIPLFYLSARVRSLTTNSIFTNVHKLSVTILT